MTIKEGDKIKVHYIGTLKDGTEFDNSHKRGTPLEYTVGSGEIIKGFDEAVIGLKIGDKKEIDLTPDKAYGDRNDQLVQKIPKEKMNIGKDPEPGMQLMVGSKEGPQFPALVKEVTDTEIVLDLNHPLCGKDLHFALEIVE